MLCYGPLVSELGDQSAWCPNPVTGRPMLPPAPPPMMPRRARSASLLWGSGAKPAARVQGGAQSPVEGQTELQGS